MCLTKLSENLSHLKSWKYSTIDSLSNLVLEQTKKDGTQVPISLDTTQSIALEQASNKAKVKIKFGKKLMVDFIQMIMNFIIQRLN